MSENKGLAVITQTAATGQLNIALTKEGLSLTKLQEQINALVFNEDNLEEIGAALSSLNTYKKTVEKAFKDGKNPYWEACQAWDKAKKAVLNQLEGLETPVKSQYETISRRVEEKKAAIAREAARHTAITEGIQNNIIIFSKKIAECTTNEELLAVERLINLEKSESRKEKYGEYHELAIAQYDEILLPILKAQKPKVKQLGTLEEQIKAATDANDVMKLDELLAEKEKLDNEIRQNQVDVQQNALHIDMLFENAPVEEILPDTNAVKRIAFEISDLVIVHKKFPELLEVNLKFKDTQKMAMTLKEAGAFKDKDEVLVNGIRFFIDKSYRP